VNEPLKKSPDMHILILSDLYPPYFKGGHELQCKFMADGLAERGHKINVLTSTYGPGKKGYDGKVYRLLHYIDLEGGRVGRRYKQIKGILFGFLNYCISRNFINKVRPDIVYAGQMTNISMYPLKAIGSYGIPIVHHVGNSFMVDLVKICDLEKNALKKTFRKIFFGYSNVTNPQYQNVITVSRMLKKKYTEVGFQGKNISVVPPVGIPLNSLRRIEGEPAMSEKEPFRLLYVGRLVPEKGVHVAIETIWKLKSQMEVSHLILDIFGDGDAGYIEQLQAIIKGYNLEETVTIKGKVPHDQLVKEYGNYHILLVPSIWDEPFGMIILEAFSQGLPVIATRTGGIPEIIEDGETGLLVPPEDSFEMAKAVRRLIDDSALGEKLISNGMEEVKRKYSDEIIVNKIEAYLNSCLIRPNQ
jgi:glycosyltransferase involved in cell wall biosynthesis